MQSECETAMVLTCNECDFFTIEPSHLENHIRSAHTISRAPESMPATVLKCNENDFFTIDPYHLENHIRSAHTISIATDSMPVAVLKCNESDFLLLILTTWKIILEVQIRYQLH